MANKKYYLDENGLKRLSEDLESRHPSTFTGTRAAWSALPEDRKVLYKIVNFTDDLEYDDPNHPNVFIGTRAEWNNLTTDEKSKFILVCLTDDLQGDGWYLANIVEENNMNPVTSNAVAIEFGNIQVFEISASSWIANTDTSTNSTYPYIYEIESSLYSDDSVPLWDMMGPVAELPTEAERDVINTIWECTFTSTKITLWANELPTVNLRLRVKGR